MLTKYIWKGRARIPMQLLQMNKKLGGLGLVDMVAKDKSLKVAWIKNLADDHILANLVYQIMCPHLQAHIWSTNLSRDDVHLIRCKNKFWTHVLEANHSCGRILSTKDYLKLNNF